jgi:predicted nuclease of predicted toxin-antitoxin system
MAQLYANENFPLKVVQILRLRGHDVLTTFEAGNAGQAIPDDAVLGYAVQSNRTVLTLNRSDFIRLHRQSSKHAGIIICTQDADVAGQAERIHEAVSAQQDLSGLLIRVNRPPR